MKKTIAALAILASASTSQALMPEGMYLEGDKSKQTERVICLSELYTENDGSKVIGSCDESEANAEYGAELKANGCAEGQLAIRTVSLQIESCPTAVQL